MATKAEQLAVDGGKRVWTKGFPAWPQFDRETDQRVLDLLHSGKVNYWTGPVGMQFEAAWAQWLGVKNAVSVANGTAALHVALLALGLGTGDEVICADGPAGDLCQTVTLAGAKPVPCAVGADRLIDPKGVAAIVSSRTRAIVVTHRCGMVADLGPVLRLARRRRLYVVEDCTQGFGGAYKGRKAGTLGTVSCFSFGPDAPFTTGGAGGMVCCDDDALAWEMRSIRDQGYDVRAKLDLLKLEAKTCYIHRRVGYNFRLTEIQSAIGLGELKRLDRWNLARRRKLGQALVRDLAGHPLVACAPVDTPERQNGYGCAPFVLDRSKLSVTPAAFVAALRAEGVAADLSDESTVAFRTCPTYALVHIRACVRAFRKVAAAASRTSGE